jgi:hypothetical protein
MVQLPSLGVVGRDHLDMVEGIMQEANEVGQDFLFRLQSAR